MPSSPVGAARVLVFASPAHPHATAGRCSTRFDEAAASLGIELEHGAYAAGQRGPRPRDTRELDEVGHDVDLDALAVAHERVPFAGVIGADDEGAVSAALAAARLGLPFHTPAGALAARQTLLTRGRLIAADLPAPWFVVLDAGLPVEAVLDRVRLPAVVAPLAPTAGVEPVRVETVEELAPAVARVRESVRAAGRVPEPEPAVMLEGFIPGRDLTLEGVMVRGQLLVLAMLEAGRPDGDAPDDEGGRDPDRAPPRVTPAALGFDDQRRMAAMVVHGALAMGLRHGPVHAVCRIGDLGLFVRRVAARPSAEPVARHLRFVTGDGRSSTLEGLLLRHAAGQSLDGWGLAANRAG